MTFPLWQLVLGTLGGFAVGVVLTAWMAVGER